MTGYKYIYGIRETLLVNTLSVHMNASIHTCLYACILFSCILMIYPLNYIRSGKYMYRGDGGIDRIG